MSNSDDTVAKRKSCCCPSVEGEAYGWVLNNAAKGCTIGAAIFLSTALLSVAESISDENDFLDGTSIKYSNVLTIPSTIFGLVSCFSMPILGAIIDHTPNRHKMAMLTCFLQTLTNIFALFISKRLFWPVLCAGLITNFMYQLHNVVFYAYLPELYDNDLQMKNASFLANVVQSCTQISFILGVLIIAGAIGTSDDEDEDVADKDDTLTAHRVAQVLAVVVGGSLYSIVWLKYMQPRPARHAKPEGSSYLTLGFKRLAYTYGHITAEYAVIKPFLLAVSCVEGAAISFITVAITFYTVELDLSSDRASLMVAITLISAIPGSIIFGKVTDRIGILTSFKYCIVWWVVIAISASFLLSKDNSSLAPIFAILYGLGFGWLGPIERAAWCPLMPAGAETEYMGLYIFAGQLLVWLPPLIFSIMNQSGASLRWGLFVNGVLFMIGLVVLKVYVEEDYDHVVKKNREAADIKKKALLERTSDVVDGQLKDDDL